MCSATVMENELAFALSSNGSGKSRGPRQEASAARVSMLGGTTYLPVVYANRDVLWLFN